MDWWDKQATMDEKLDHLVEMLNAASTLHYRSNFPGLVADVHGYSKGKKYARVYRDHSNGQRFVNFFVDLSTGDVWKADGWKKPALNFTRGNISTAEGRWALTGGKMSKTGYFYPGIG